MTIRCFGYAEQKAVVGQAGSRRLREFLGRLGALIVEWGGAGSLRTSHTLDGMSEEQLDDIGVSRIARRARWLDGRETPVPMDFAYRLAPDRRDDHA